MSSVRRGPPWHRVLIIRPGALGDVLLTLPAAQAVLAASPETHLEVMGDLRYLRSVCGRSAVRAVASFDATEVAALFSPDMGDRVPIGAYLRSFDLVLSYVGPAESQFGRNLERLVAHAVHWDARAHASLDMHMSRFLQEPLAMLGIPTTDDPPCIMPSEGDIDTGARWWLEHGLRRRWVLAVHPGSGSSAKNWPVESFAEAVRRLCRDRDATVLLVQGPADAAPTVGLARALEGVRCVVLRELPLELLATIIARCSLYLGNDSGVSHLAAALGVPVVAVFGPTSPQVWAPRGPKVSVVSGDESCSPCSVAQRQSCAERRCLSNVSVAQVAAAANSIAVNGREDLSDPGKWSGT